MPSHYPSASLHARRAPFLGGWAAACVLSLALAFAPGSAHAQLWTSRPMAAQAEAHNETAAPSYSRHVHDVQRITAYLTDVLRLSTAQQLALQSCTVAERAALLLAATDADAQAAQAHYLAAVRRVLATSQLRTYVLLRQQLEGTVLPLDGLGLAAI